MTNEELALDLASSPKRLRARLNEARALLPTKQRRTFGKGTFDPVARTLTGDNGVILQWKLRQHADSPESYQNQQTSRGLVTVLQVRRAVG